jgi:hypothetical protein
LTTWALSATAEFIVFGHEFLAQADKLGQMPDGGQNRD